MILATPRLTLRPWREEDLEPLTRLMADPDVMRHFPAPLTPAETRERLQRAQRSMRERGLGWWAVERPGFAPFIGYVGLGVPDFEAPFTPCVEIVWQLAKDQWGRGLAPEGARAVLDHAFGPLGLQEVVAYTARPNHASRRVMEKLGMTHDPADDFCHPKAPPDHPLGPCVLYRIRADYRTSRIASPGK